MSEPDALRKLNSVLSRKASREGVETQQGSRGVVLQFPYPLRSDESAMPNEIVRSALFTAHNRRTPRRQMVDAEIYIAGDLKMLFNGEELRSNDEDLFLFFITCFENKPASTRLLLTESEIVKGLGLQKNSKAFKRVKDSIWRMKKAAFQIQRDGGNPVMMGLLSHATLTESEDRRVKNGIWSISLSEETIALFSGNRHTRIDLEMRAKISSGVVALKLFEFYSSHKNPYALKLGTLYRFCFNAEPGSDQDLRMFKYRVKKALTEFVTLGVIGSFDFTLDGLVRVTREVQQPLL